MLINGVDPAVAYGFRMSEPPGWADAPSFISQTAVISALGVRPMGAPVMQPRKITLRGFIEGSSASAARTNLDRLKLATSIVPCRLIFDDYPTRYIDTRDGDVVVRPGAASVIARKFLVDITLIAYDPLFYDITATGPFNSDPLPLGTAPVFPRLEGGVVVFTGPAIINLVDYLGATVLSMSIAVGIGGSWLVIDSATQTVTVGGTDVTEAVSGDFFMIDPRIHADFVNSLWPHFTFSGFDSGTPGQISYRKAWL